MIDARGATRGGCKFLSWLVFLVCYIAAANARAQENSVSLNVVISPAAANNAKAPAGRISDASNVVVWLTPIDRPPANTSSFALPAKPPQIVQRHKIFEPHLLVVPIGTMVQFPNKDPFFHNIFSLYDGKRFDLGLYESGSARSVSFDRPGASFLFCNIHAEMSAVVVAVDTPYFALSDRSGNVVIRNVPNGRYQLNVWYERSLPGQLKELNRVATISDSARTLGVIHIVENPDFTSTHKNKYGLDYVPPPKTDYDHP
jgi:plastocyanin